MATFDLSSVTGAPNNPGVFGLLNASTGFPEAPPPVDEAALAQEAREAAAARLGRRGESRRNWGARVEQSFAGPDVSNAAISVAMGQTPPSVFGSLSPVVGVPAPTPSPAPQAAQPMQPGASAPELPPAKTIVPAPSASDAGPIAVGDYTMPRIGLSQLYAMQQAKKVDPAELPQGATATQGSGNPAAIPETSLLGRIGRALSDNSNLLLSAGAGMAGAPSFGVGMSRAFQMAVPGSELDQKNQARNLTVAALMKRGMPEDAARAAASNPAILNQILPMAFGAKQSKLDKLKDAFGNETPVWVDEVNRKMYGMDGKEITSAGGIGSADGGAGAGNIEALSSSIEQARAGGASPQQLYQLVPAPYREGVQAMLEGRGIPANLGRANIKPLIVMLGHAIDPTFDENQIQSRQKGFNDWYGGGASSETSRKLNQSALHFGELVTDKMSELPGHQVPLANWAANGFNTHVLGKGAQNNFLVNAHALADELGGLFKGHNLSDSEIKAWESGLSPDMSVEQQRGMAKTLLGLYRDGAAALEKKRVEAIGPVAAAQKGPLLGPEAQAALKRIEDFAYGRDAGRGSTAAGIPNGAIAALRTDPSLAGQFDEKYGPGSAAKVLGH